MIVIVSVEEGRCYLYPIINLLRSVVFSLSQEKYCSVKDTKLCNHHNRSALKLRRFRNITVNHEFLQSDGTSNAVKWSDGTGIAQPLPHPSRYRWRCGAWMSGSSSRLLCGARRGLCEPRQPLALLGFWNLARRRFLPLAFKRRSRNFSRLTVDRSAIDIFHCPGAGNVTTSSLKRCFSILSSASASAW